MTTIVALVAAALVAVQRCTELAYARRNTEARLARGGREWGRAHYPYLIALHAAWLLTIAAVAVVHPPTAISWWLLGIFVVLQAARQWAIATLRERWTTRIVTLAGEPLIRTGPYRFLRHPSYVVVALEIAVLPLAFEQYAVAVVFTLANAVMLAVRIRVENCALQQRRA